MDYHWHHTERRVQKLCESENLELFEACMHNPLEMFESEQYTSKTTENLKLNSFVWKYDKPYKYNSISYM